MYFTKMHGAGNDYIYLNCLQQMPKNLPELARKLSKRRFGVGADGLICICPSDVADYKMMMFNADGSEGAMCGNGIRCVGKYLFDKGITTQQTLRIETASGVKPLVLHIKNGKADAVTVDIGSAAVKDSYRITIMGKEYTGIHISVGNPHFVVEVPDVKKADLEKIGSLLQRHELFPDGVNVELIQRIGQQLVSARVWERGSGETYACGTGAAAIFAAQLSQGKVGRCLKISFPGGMLEVKKQRSDGHLLLTGPAVTVFEGWVGEE